MLFLFRLVIVVISKRKSATYGDKDQLIDTSGAALPVNNPAFVEDYEDMDDEQK